MNYFTIYPNLPEYKSNAQEELKASLESEGYIYHQGSFGGGPGEIKEVIVAWIGMHPLLTGLIVNIVANRIDALLVRFYKWHLKNKKADTNIAPIINITVYPTRLRKKQNYKVSFRIDKKYSKAEIVIKLKEARNIHNSTT